MNTNELFHEPNYVPKIGTKKEVGCGKLVKRLRWNLIVDNNNCVYQYFITPEGVKWSFWGSVFVMKRSKNA